MGSRTWVFRGLTPSATAPSPMANSSIFTYSSANLPLIRGGHTIKFGGEGRKTNYNDRGEIDARGAFSFTGAMTQNPQSRNTTGVSVADLLLGLPLTAAGESTSLSGNFNSFGYYGFVQDDWKVSSRLTLNLGLRYEFNTRY